MRTQAATRKPLVGVMCCNRVIGSHPSQVISNRFIAPLQGVSDVSCMIVPAIPGALDPAVATRTLDALLLTGSCSNVSPQRYGSNEPEDRLDLDRDETVARLAGAMIDAGLPVLGICRGLQELNVLFGGTLTHNVHDTLKHHAPIPSDSCPEELFRHRHDIQVTGKVLASRLESSRVQVNSVHHQGIAILGAGLDPQAIAPDGLVEAFHAQPAGADVLAVQWHPEADIAEGSYGSSFFSTLGEMARGQMLGA